MIHLQQQKTLKDLTKTLSLKQIKAKHKLTDVKESDYDAVFYPGGHGMGLATDKNSIALIAAFILIKKR
jgi:putative intracellular protease/amidase